jgi:hypothetical protein
MMAFSQRAARGALNLGRRCALPEAMAPQRRLAEGHIYPLPHAMPWETSNPCQTPPAIVGQRDSALMLAFSQRNARGFNLPGAALRSAPGYGEARPTADNALRRRKYDAAAALTSSAKAGGSGTA